MQRRSIVLPPLAAACCCLAAICAVARAETSRRPHIDAPLAAIGDIARAHFLPPALPSPTVRRHRLALPGRTLAFTAESGAVVFKDARGMAAADITYFAYQLEGADRRHRPVTFAINGGPGSASAWLHIGGLGPWRLAYTAKDGAVISSELVANAETWLDFTDLVFIDAASTGFSRFHSYDESLQRTFFAFDGDIAALTVFVRRWLEGHDRLGSPKVFLGESYSGLRAPHVAKILAARPATALEAVILVSPVLAPSAPWEASARQSGEEKITPEVLVLPSVAAQLAGRRGEPSLQRLPEFERYAMGAYRADLATQPLDAATSERLIAGLASITGLPIDKVREASTPTRVASPHDLLSGRRILTRLSKESDTQIVWKVDLPLQSQREVVPEFDLSGPIQQAMLALAKDKLGWLPERDYEMRGSTWSRTGLESMTPLRAMLTRVPEFRVLVAHGAHDTLTPYFASKVLLKPLLGDGSHAKVALEVYEGGHMFYFRDDSRTGFRQDAASFYAGLARLPRRR